MVAVLPAVLLSAQTTEMTAALITDGVRGSVTYVLGNGTMGSVGGYDKVRSRRPAIGARVVTLDPYRLSMHSADLTFVALSLRV